MNDYRRKYYLKMMKLDRMFPLRDDRGHLFGCITYFIGNGDPSKFEREDMWSIVPEDKDGDTVYIDHCLCDKGVNHSKYTFKIWRDLKKYLKTKHSQIKSLRWNRFKDGEHFIFRKEF